MLPCCHIKKYLMFFSEMLAIWSHFPKEMQTDCQDALAGGAPGGFGCCSHISHISQILAKTTVFDPAGFSNAEDAVQRAH